MTIQTLGNYGGSPPQAAAPSSEPRVVVSAQVARSDEIVAQAPQTAPSREQVEKVVDSLKKSVGSATSNNLQFSIDNDTGKTVVRVVDTQSGQTIRQIPTEEVLEMAKALDQMKGVLLKQQA